MGQNALFDDYDAFIKKFAPKKTTDDCYTPPKVYEAVLAWARQRYGIPADAPIVRPFFPGGDYENADYPAGCYVVDNPPFSIMAKIVRFYQARKIPFFLFANGLTLCINLKIKGVGAVVVRDDIRYHNGACINTGFLTNMGENVVEVAPELSQAIRVAQGRSARNRIAKLKRKIELPDAVVTGATLQRLVTVGSHFRVRHGEAVFVRTVGDEQYNLFGGGLLLSERVAEERVAEERVAEERVAVRRFALSSREKELQRLMARGLTQ